MKQWLTEQVESGEVHVVPLDDVVTHSEVDCACGPSTEAVYRDGGSNGWLVTHHSLDGREAKERARG